MQLQLLLNCSKPRAVDVKINDFTLALSDYTSQPAVGLRVTRSASNIKSVINSRKLYMKNEPFFSFL